MTLFFNLILGWLGAQLVNYLADVLPLHRKLVSPACSNCGQGKTWAQYLFLSACDHCGTRVGARHLALQILGPVLGGLLYYFPIQNLGNYGAILWLLYFGLVVIIDLEHRLILHPVSWFGGFIGLVFGVLNHGWVNTLIGGAAGFGIMLIFYFLGDLFVRLLSKSRGEEIAEVALGFGDVNLAGVLGLLLGWPGIVGGIFLAIILGGVVSGIYLLVQSIRKRYQAFQALPYGPFLVISAILLFYISQFLN